MLRIREIFRRFRGHMTHPARLTITGAAVLILAISGPFGSYNILPFAQRLVFWFIMVATPLTITNLGRAVFDSLRPGMAWPQQALLLSALTAAMSTPVIATVIRLCNGSPYFFSGNGVLIIPAMVFSITLFVIGARETLAPRQAPARPRLFRRLADGQACRVLRVSVRDHKVDVYTDRGTETLLMRFRDALDELDGIAGIRVHRSHWVARDAVDSYIRRKGRSLVRLCDGSEVPVSRGCRPAVEEALAGTRRGREPAPVPARP